MKEKMVEREFDENVFKRIYQIGVECHDQACPGVNPEDAREPD